MSDKPSQTRWLFILLLLVAVASLTAILVLHANTDLQWLVQILSAPFVVSLLGVVVQALLWEQQKQHAILVQQNTQKHEEILQEIRLQHEQFQQEREHSLQLGAVSGIAERVFNGYADFCEEYLSALYEIHDQMIYGSLGEWEQGAQKLAKIRLGHAAWVPVELDCALWDMERALQEGSNNIELAKQCKQEGDTETASKLQKNVFQIWKQLRDVEDSASSEEKRRSLPSVIDLLKEVMEIDRMTDLRRELVRKCTNSGSGENPSPASSEGAGQE